MISSVLSVAQLAAPAAMFVLCIWGLVDPAFGPGKDTINCPNHCGQPNIFIKGDTWIYVMGSGVAATHLLGELTEDVRLKLWLAFASLVSLISVAFVAIFFAGLEFGSLDNWLVAVWLPLISGAQVALYYYDQKVQPVLRNVELTQLMDWIMWMAIVVLAGVLWSFEVSNYTMQVTIANGASRGRDLLLNVTYVYSEDDLDAVIGPSDGVIESEQFSCTDCRITGLRPRTLSILNNAFANDNALTRYLGLTLLVLFPAILTLIGTMLGMKVSNRADLVRTITNLVHGKLAVMTAVFVLVPRQPLSDEVGDLFYLTYITGITTPIYMLNKRQLSGMGPFIAMMNTLVFVASMAWKDDTPDGAWLHDVQPAFAILTMFLDRQHTKNVIRPGMVEVVYQSIALLTFYGTWTQVHYQLYDITPYGGAVAPPPSVNVWIWIAITSATVLINVLNRIMALQLLKLPVTRQELTKRHWQLPYDSEYYGSTLQELPNDSLELTSVR